MLEISSNLVNDLQSIFELALLFNGNLFLEHRINQLASWINILNSKGFSIILITTKVIISLQDSWLSGFTDTEGCFNVNIFKRIQSMVGYRVILRFLVDQNDLKALLFICTLFGFGNVSLRTNKTTYRFTIAAYSRLHLVANYFNSYPLKSKKSTAFNRWL